MSKKSRKKKQAIRNLENHLRFYPFYKVGIKNLQEEIESIEPSVTTSYEPREGSTGVFNVYSTTEDTAIKKIESPEVNRARERMDKYKKIVDQIERAMTKLNDEERKYIKLRYFDELPVQEICERLYCNERYLFRLRYKVLNKLLICMATFMFNKA